LRNVPVLALSTSRARLRCLARSANSSSVGYIRSPNCWGRDIGTPRMSSVVQHGREPIGVRAEAPAPHQAIEASLAGERLLAPGFCLTRSGAVV
jgi:hypothetical protein